MIIVDGLVGYLTVYNWCQSPIKHEQECAAMKRKDY